MQADDPDKNAIPANKMELTLPTSPINLIHASNWIQNFWVEVKFRADRKSI